MRWNVEYTDEFEEWWDTLDEKEQIAVAVTVGLLEEMGPNLPFPYSSAIHGSKHGHMRENFAANAAANLCEHFTLLIRDGRQSYSSVGKKQARIVGTKHLFH
jgi:hypothetical protein